MPNIRFRVSINPEPVQFKDLRKSDRWNMGALIIRPEFLLGLCRVCTGYKGLNDSTSGWIAAFSVYEEPDEGP